MAVNYFAPWLLTDHCGKSSSSPAVRASSRSDRKRRARMAVRYRNGLIGHSPSPRWIVRIYGRPDQASDIMFSLELASTA